MQNRRLDALARKLSAIEQLADGSLTAAYRAEEAAVEAQLAAMRKPSADTQAAIRTTQARLDVIRRALADREAALIASKSTSQDN
jgi:septal ring factor EnvC (AmiA/AmiB activator)